MPNNMTAVPPFSKNKVTNYSQGLTFYLLPPCNSNAKISKQLNFNLQAQEMSAMTKCPRCNLKQEESSQCEYCGLVFEEFKKSSRISRLFHSKRTVLFAIILLVAGTLLASYLLITYQDRSGGKSTHVARSGDPAQTTKENDLRTTARELSGGVGMLNKLVGGYTKGSIIAIGIFSIIGLGYLTYGKKSQQLLMLICGLALMGYPYLVSGIIYIILIGVALSALPFIFGRK
jgi:hypothetical protein